MEQQIFDYAMTILSIIFTAVVGIVGKEIIRYLRTHQKGKLALLAVQFVEETYKDLDGGAKFAKAIDWFVNQLHNVGIKNISNDEAKGYIQASVKEMRQVLNKEYEDPANDVSPEPVKDATEEVVKEVEKPVAEMTSTDLENVVKKVFKEQLQSQTPVSQPTPTPAPASVQ